MSARSRAALAVALLCAPAPAAAQQHAKPQTQHASEVLRARELGRAGRVTEAASLLRAVLESCALVARPGECRRGANFDLGYLYQTAAAHEPADSGLRTAARYYRDVLADAPGHQATVANLALVYGAMKPASLMPAELERTAEADPAHAPTYLVLLGDHYRAVGDLERARAAYREAAERAPGDPAPRTRLVASYRGEGAVEMRALAALLPAWDETSPDVALDGERVVIANAYARQPDLAEQALVRWVVLHARIGDLSAERLDELPADWRTPPVTDLRAYLVDPWHAPGPATWWMKSHQGRDALAAAAVTLGQRMAQGGAPERARNCWRVAVSFTPEDSRHYLELSRELASLYYRNPALDPDGAQLDSLEDRLFQGKSLAIASADQAAMQRFHTVLGLIYAERGAWTGRPPWRSAIYQLEHALAAAATLERRDGLHQPLAQLRWLLATGYSATGRRADAGHAYLDATRAYLDTDDLGHADTALDRAAELAPAPEAARLRRLLELRRAVTPRTDAAAPGSGGAAVGALAAIASIRTLAACTMDAVDGATLDADAQRTTLDGVPVSTPTDRFLARQRFKLLADCAAAGGADAPRFAAEAFALAADARLPRVQLTGGADLVRLESARDAVLRRFGLPADATRFASAAPAAAAASPERVALVTDAGPSWIVVEPATRLVGRIARALPSGPEPVRLSVRGDTVVLAAPAEAQRSAELQRRLLAVEGVARVEVVQPR